MVQNLEHNLGYHFDVSVGIVQQISNFKIF